MQFVIDYFKEHLDFAKYYEKSLTVAGNAYLFMAKKSSGEKSLVAVLKKKSDSAVFERFTGSEALFGDYAVKVCPLTPENASALRESCPFTKPSAAGAKTAFGFGDRLGNSTPGHARAAAEFSVFPVFAQQSVREMSRTGKTPSEVLDDAAWGVFQENYRKGYGADADHLKTVEDLRAAVKAGFTMFTVDPSEHISDNADEMKRDELDSRFDSLFENQKQKKNLLDFYLNYSFEKLSITFSYTDIKREAVKYLPAVRHACFLYDELAGMKGGAPFDFEVSIDETSKPTTEKSHIFIITRLLESGVHITSLAPRFPGEFQKGIDYRGDAEELKRALKNHRTISMENGNYKLSIHSGSDKFSIFPLIGKITHKKFHGKTAGTSYIEAVRVAARKSPKLYRQIHEFALEKFEEDRHSYQVTTDLSKIPELSFVPDEGLEELLDSDDCRQLIHITYGSVLQVKDSGGNYLFRDRLMGVLDRNEEDYYEALRKHFVKHLQEFGLKRKT